MSVVKYLHKEIQEQLLPIRAKTDIKKQMDMAAMTVLVKEAFQSNRTVHTTHDTNQTGQTYPF